MDWEKWWAEKGVGPRSSISGSGCVWIRFIVVGYGLGKIEIRVRLFLTLKHHKD